MSRVKSNQKFVNTPTTKKDIYVSSSPCLSHYDDEDYHKADSLTRWLKLKYNKTYKWFRNKSTKRRNELREEYKNDIQEMIDARNNRDALYNKIYNISDPIIRDYVLYQIRTGKYVTNIAKQIAKEFNLLER